MSLNKIMSKIKEWNNDKNKTDLKHSSNTEVSFYNKETDTSQVLNEVNLEHYGNGIQY